MTLFAGLTFISTKRGFKIQIGGDSIYAKPDPILGEDWETFEDDQGITVSVPQPMTRETFI